MLKKVKGVILACLISLLFIPQMALAYSEYIIPGGETIGITLNTKGIIIVGMYNVGSTYPGREAKLKTGDAIMAVNSKKVDGISDMIATINNSVNKEEVNISYERNGTTYNTTLKLVKNSDGVYQTGLYVKDSINGLGTLSFIDPETKYFGALGHEIIESNTGLRLEIKDGKIYDSEVTSIRKGERGAAGEKNAKFKQDNVRGTIKDNTISGIFGTYTDTLPNKDVLKVATKDEVKLGKAQIRTVLDGTTVETFDIIITKIDMSKDIKNFLFEVTDQTLLAKTGGIVQGMSGSPIIQGDKIIGAVTHVLVDSPNKGYGIFIRNMLEEAER